MQDPSLQKLLSWGLKSPESISFLKINQIPQMNPCGCHQKLMLVTSILSLEWCQTTVPPCALLSLPLYIPGPPGTFILGVCLNSVLSPASWFMHNVALHLLSQCPWRSALSHFTTSGNRHCNARPSPALPHSAVASPLAPAWYRKRNRSNGNRILNGVKYILSDF